VKAGQNQPTPSFFAGVGIPLAHWTAEITLLVIFIVTGTKGIFFGLVGTLLLRNTMQLLGSEDSSTIY
jgi:hypothetical protein